MRCVISLLASPVASLLLCRWMVAKQRAAFAVRPCPMLLPPLRGWPRSRMDTQTTVTGTLCYSAFSVRKCMYKQYIYVCSTAMLEESQDGMDSGTLGSASARQVTIQRHPTQGFGFIAGSQRPVIVRSVSAGQSESRESNGSSHDSN